MGRKRLASGLAVLAVLGLVAAAPSAAAVEAEEPVATRTALTLDSAEPNTGAGITVTATVTSASGEVPQGGIDFFVDGVVQGLAVALADGTATVNLSIQSPGIHTIRATFNQQSNFASSSAEISADIGTPPGSDTIPVPGRPQLPRAVGSSGPEPAPEADEPEVAASTTTAAPAPPSELPNTGAFAIPGLLLGSGSVGLGLLCRRYSRRA
jgi:hypothetical protein